MREILFKAKRTDNGEWVEGYYIYHIKRTICAFGDSVKPEDEQHVIMQDGFSDWNMPRGTVAFEIAPETLCQYTGLTDKNGKKIWENDIVKHEISSGLGQVIWYQEDYIGWIVDDIWTDGQQYSHEMFSECEVIGNIFDNPELLEEE